MTLLIIPSRLESSRLQHKPLQMIGKHTLIQHVVFRAIEAGFHPTVVTDHVSICDAVEDLCDVLLRFEPQPTGTDRVADAAEYIDPERKHKYIVNLQGDMPFIDPYDIRSFVRFLEQVEVPRVTAYAIQEPVISFPNTFIRQKQNVHIGIYGFTRAALDEFHRKPQSPDEIKMGLEQLRVSPWEFIKFNTAPLEVNTQAELERARLCHQQ